MIVMSAGTASRFRSQPVPKKQWLRIGRTPLWKFVAERLAGMSDFAEVLITAHPDECAYMESFSPFTIVPGGETRQESLRNALEHVSTPYVMVTDVARPCVPESVIMRLLDSKEQGECIVPYLKVHDTVVYEQNTIERDLIKRIQTPQLSQSDFLQKALETDTLYTDDSSAIKAVGGNVIFVEGSEFSGKITYLEDLNTFHCLEAPSPDCISGIGFDVHAFEVDKPMVLGGVKVESSFGFKAHSDGDVLIHSIIDALLGAVGAGDIGEWFPDNDPAFKNADSTLLLEAVVEFIRHIGYEIVHVDATIMTEVPKISPYKALIRNNLSALMDIPLEHINIKATTMEKMGFVGRKEGSAVQSIATLKYYDWKNICRS